MQLQGHYHATLTEQRSRFHALLFGASSEAALREVLAEQKRLSRKANHHCWAARLMLDGRTVEMARDDGEVGRPGMVLLALLQRADLHGGLVVSRIFGGVKLGPGGVSRAFQRVGAAALEERLGAG